MRRIAQASRKAGSVVSVGTASVDGDCDLDEKDDTKRKSRNLSEKKRRDQFNMLINELCSMVSTTTRKMDKSTVLRSTISFLRSHSEVSPQSESPDIQENWKPSFLSNEEFTHLMLEALDGFIMVFSCSGKILYTSESVSSLMGYLPRDLTSIFDLIHDSDRPALFKLLNSAPANLDRSNLDSSTDTCISLLLHMKHGPMYSTSSNTYELVRLHGTFYNWNPSSNDASTINMDYDSNSCSSVCSPMTPASTSVSTSNEWKTCFVAMARLQTPQLLREMTLSDGSKNEFTSRHSFEWKFLFLDHRAPPIIGYLPFEVLGTSGYDYYHIDDLDRVAASHEALMQTGEGTSCYYRFLTKGQQWIWMQTRYYITYHQWNSKPEFIVCTHTVFSYEEVRNNLKQSQVSKTNSDVEARVDSSSSNSSNTSSLQSGNLSQAKTQPSGQALTSFPTSSVTARSQVISKTSDVVAVSSSNHSNLKGIHSKQNLINSSSNSSSTSNTSTVTANKNASPTPRSLPPSTQDPQERDRDMVSDQSCSLLANAQIIIEDCGIPQVLSTLPSSAPAQATPTPVITLAALPQFMEMSDTSLSSVLGQTQNEQPELQPGVITGSGGVNLSTTTTTTSDLSSMNQSQIQEYLRCRHQLIQQQILFQQEELRRVSEQLMLVQFVPPPNLSLTTLPCQTGLGSLTLASSGAVFQPSSFIQTPQQHNQNQTQEHGISKTVVTHSVSNPAISTTTAIIDPQSGVHVLPPNTHLMPLSLSQEQAQVVFGRSFGHSTHHLS